MAKKRNYLKIIDQMASKPWAILPDKLAELREIFLLHLAAEEISEEAWHPARQAFEAKVNGARARSGRGVAVLPVFGVIGQRMNLFMEMSGGTSLEKFTKEFRAAMADPMIGAVVMDIESPGGSVFGVEEAASEIFQARGQKPIVAVADSFAASAAYWLATQADEIVGGPSSQVGSIGVIALHEDFSKANEMLGVKPTYITSSRFKAEGNPDEPLSEEARAAIQKDVDAYDRAFVRAVARGRGVTQKLVRSDFGEGRMLMAADALEVGMIDRIETLDQTLSRLLSGSSRGPRAQEKLAIDEWGLRLKELEG